MITLIIQFIWILYLSHSHNFWIYTALLLISVLNDEILFYMQADAAMERAIAANWWLSRSSQVILLFFIAVATVLVIVACILDNFIVLSLGTLSFTLAALYAVVRKQQIDLLGNQTTNRKEQIWCSLEELRRFCSRNANRRKRLST